jgi:hypothetical protein
VRHKGFTAGESDPAAIADAAMLTLGTRLADGVGSTVASRGRTGGS